MSRRCLQKVIAALQAGQVDLTDPAVTVELLRLNAVVGVKGTVDDGRSAHESGRDLRAVPLVCRQLLRAGHRKAARWLGEHGPERRRDRRPLASIGRRHEGRVQKLGTRKVRPASSRVRRHQHHSAEQSVAADRDPSDLRVEGRGLRDVHRRRPHFVLEQLRRRGPDGWPRQLQRSANRIVHQADAGSRHAEAGRAAGLPIELAQPEASARQFQSQGR